MMFLDADRPLPGCTAENCDGCEISEKLVCHYNIRQLMGFLVMAAPVFLLGGYFRQGGLGLLVVGLFGS